MMLEFTWWWALTIPIALVLESLLHEAAHITAGILLENARLVEWHPWPGYVMWEDQGMKKRQWAWAWYRMEATDNSPPQWMRHAAPSFAGITWAFMFIIVANLFSGTDIESVFLPFIACGVGDGLLFLYTCIFGSEFSDGKKFRMLFRRKGSR